MKLLPVFLCLLFFFLPAQAEENTLNIVAANFPCFDLVRSICGENANVRMLLPPGSESHSYEPTPHDIIAIQECDMFVYTGGESDNWIESILVSMDEEAPETFRLVDHVPLLASEVTKSMEDHHHHEHGEKCTDPDHLHGEVHSHGMDEHVWTSPKNMIALAEALTKKLCETSPALSSVWKQAAERYISALKDLDRTFEQIVSSASRNLLIFGDRFPARYFAAAYGLMYDAAFPGCSEDSEPSVRTVISLVDTVRTEQIPVVFYIEFSSRRTADIIAEETGAHPMLFHSCHNVSNDEIEAGATYLSLMYQNAEALKEALN